VVAVSLPYPVLPRAVPGQASPLIAVPGRPGLGATPPERRPLCREARLWAVPLGVDVRTTERDHRRPTAPHHSSGPPPASTPVARRPAPNRDMSCAPPANVPPCARWHELPQKRPKRQRQPESAVGPYRLKRNVPPIGREALHAAVALGESLMTTDDGRTMNQTTR